MIDDRDLLELQTRADLPSLLRGEGIRLTRSAGGFRCACPLHGGDNQTSFSLFQDQDHAWRWKCHSRDCGSGDTLEYLRKRHNFTFQEAVEELVRSTGFQPAGLEAHEPFPPRPLTPLPPMQPHQPRLDPLEQVESSTTFLQLLKKMPEAAMLGSAYCNGRGISESTLSAHGGAYQLDTDKIASLVSWLSQPERSYAIDAFLKAGIMRKSQEGTPKLNWWGKVVLFPCLGVDGSTAWNFTARRLDWSDGDTYGKYLHQSTALGAVLHPYGLPSLGQASREERDLLIVEGVFDCLGAHTLGHLALAMLRRPGANGWMDSHSATVRVLEPILPQLRRCRRIDVVPDQDGGKSEAIGWRKAEGLSSWLRGFGIDSSVLSLRDLGFPHCKDLGEAAERGIAA